ncbi:hypothetical protein JRQ81_014960 [Phrynocephalus forsythii]|uniref:Uncharacterized protein n=1 Tax=Phrynocephalus forsythii TaxID=171643 RepID=A0A9Q0XYP3_9SAUR|nr:hypothetical protein JRQ81_014960 [Phrynocephalus forsythii]
MTCSGAKRLDVRCFCTRKWPCSNTSPFTNGVCKVSPPDSMEQPCKFVCHSARSHLRLSCHLCQSHTNGPSVNQACSSNDWRLYPHFFKHSSPICFQRIPMSTCFERCIPSHPWRHSVQADGNSTQPVFSRWTASSRDSVQEAANFAEHWLTGRSCTVCSLDTRPLDPTCQHGCCVPSLPKHYAIYSSPVSLRDLQNECGHRFSNNVPPVLVAVYPSKRGSPPHMEQLAQIDRTPMPPIQDCYLVFSRY